MQKVVFLDRDGTINVDKHYLSNADEFEYLEGAKDGLRMFQKSGYGLVVITNQSGIARGYYTEEDYYKLSKWMEDDLSKSGISLLGQYFCPHLQNAAVERYRIDCDCRKPKIGMFLQAIKDHDIDIDQSIVIGDKPRDLSICSTDIGRKMRGFLVYSDENREEKNITVISGGIYDVAKLLLK